MNEEAVQGPITLENKILKEIKDLTDEASRMEGHAHSLMMQAQQRRCEAFALTMGREKNQVFAQIHRTSGSNGSNGKAPTSKKPRRKK